jgi:hypothetical protein
MYRLRLLKVSRSEAEMQAALRMDAWLRLSLMSAAVALLAIVLLAAGASDPRATAVVAVAAIFGAVASWRRFSRSLDAVDRAPAA